MVTPVANFFSLFAFPLLESYFNEMQPLSYKTSFFTYLLKYLCTHALYTFFSLNKISCHNFYCFYYIFFISYWYLHACFSLSHKLSSQHAGSLHLICMQACLSKFTCHQTSIQTTKKRNIFP